MSGFARPRSSRSITIADGIFASASRTPQKVAIREAGAITDLLPPRRTHRAIGQCRARPFQSGARRAGSHTMPNRIEYLEIVCGLSSAGVAACTIGPAASPAEIRFICEDSSSRVLFVAPALEEAARAAVGDIVPHIVALDERYETLLANARSELVAGRYRLGRHLLYPLHVRLHRAAQGRDAVAPLPRAFVLRHGVRARLLRAR